jgi:nucleotide-binding universal stress UspA family protein
MFKHVLIPLDGSDVAEKALDYARQVTDPEGRIMLLSAIDVPQYPASTFHPAGVVAYNTSQEVVVEDLLPQAEEYLKKIAESLRRSGYKVEIEATVGEAAMTIVERAKSLNVDVIVMSTHGRSGISRWLFGSVASKVLGSTHCPVLIVPAKQVS